jgi:hypothetical protein
MAVLNTHYAHREFDVRQGKIAAQTSVAKFSILIFPREQNVVSTEIGSLYAIS